MDNDTKFGTMTADDFSDLEKIVGAVDRENGMTPTQQDALAAYGLHEAGESIMDSPVAEHKPLLPELIHYRHFVFSPDADPESYTAQYQRMYSMLATQAYKTFLVDPAEVTEFLDFGKACALKSFAGEKVKTVFPSANTWIEIVYPEGRRPMIAPVGENIDTAAMRLRINRIAMHATCGFSMFPFPYETDGPEVAEIVNSPTFLKEAHVTFFLDVEGHGIQMYSGTIQYGFGGARVFKVTSAEQGASAIHGEPPSLFGHSRMPNFCQFACGTLAQVLLFFQSKGTMNFDALRAYHMAEGHTGFSDDVSFAETA